MQSIFAVTFINDPIISFIFDCRMHLFAAYASNCVLIRLFNEIEYVVAYFCKQTSLKFNSLIIECILRHMFIRKFATILCQKTSQ